MYILFGCVVLTSSDGCSDFWFASSSNCRCASFVKLYVIRLCAIVSLSVLASQVAVLFSVPAVAVVVGDFSWYVSTAYLLTGMLPRFHVIVFASRSTALLVSDMSVPKLLSLFYIRDSKNTRTVMDYLKN